MRTSVCCDSPDESIKGEAGIVGWTGLIDHSAEGDKLYSKLPLPSVGSQTHTQNLLAFPSFLILSLFCYFRDIYKKAVGQLIKQIGWAYWTISNTRFIFNWQGFVNSCNPAFEVRCCGNLFMSFRRESFDTTSPPSGGLWWSPYHCLISGLHYFSNHVELWMHREGAETPCYIFNA